MATYSTTFDDPAENPLSDGGVWQSGPGTFGGVKKSGGKVSNIVDGESTCGRCNSAAFGSDQYAEATLSDTSTSKFPGVFTRIQSSSDGDSYFVEITESSSVLTLYRIDDTGSLGFTQLGATFAITIAVPDDVRLESNGSTHEVFWNSVSLGTRSDATFTGGLPGFGAYATSNSDPYFTAWDGGDLGGGALTLAIADTITFTDALTKSVGAVKTDALTLSDAIAKSVSAAKTDAITFSDALGNATGKAASDAISFSDSSTTASGKNIADTVSFSDAESNGFGKATTDALSFSDTRTASAGKSTSDAISFTDTLAIPGFVTDTLTFGDSLTTTFTAGACPPGRYVRRPLSWISSPGCKNPFAEITCDARKPLGVITSDATRTPFNPD